MFGCSNSLVKKFSVVSLEKQDMGFILTDLGNQDNQLFVNFWNWRPTVELIRSFGILDEGRIELLHMQTIGDTVTISEAHQIGERIKAEILPLIPEGGRMLLDLSVSIKPDDGVMYYGEDTDKNYNATTGWLSEFATFCLNCAGFRVF